MRVTFSGLETVLEVGVDHVEVLEIENRVLFSRVVQSILSDGREDAVEPYLYWKENDVLLSAREKPLVVVNPFDLPWGDKRLFGALPARIQMELLDDEAARFDIERLTRELAGKLFGLTLGMEAGYALDVEWDLAKYLKSFGFAVDREKDGPLIDNLEEFMRLAADAAFALPIVFVNLKSFLGEKEVDRLYFQAKNLELSLLLLESAVDDTSRSAERKHAIDLQFLEY